MVNYFCLVNKVMIYRLIWFCFYWSLCVICSEKHQEVTMHYEAAAQERYQEMCRIVGDVVFAMVAKGIRRQLVLPTGANYAGRIL
ncbi:DUF2767 family protein [Salmonella enterica]